jgi:DNA polymerase
MLIGEAPGANEDVEGIPFCGQSGQLLDNMLRSIGYDNCNAYITNTTFWRPPGNRKPTAEELDICKPFVEKHIALLNPKLLVLVGGVAIADVLNTTESVGKLRLKFHDYTNKYLDKPIKVMCTFHPSYLLRSPSQKALAWKDWLMVKRELLSV